MEINKGFVRLQIEEVGKIGVGQSFGNQSIVRLGREIILSNCILFDTAI